MEQLSALLRKRMLIFLKRVANAHVHIIKNRMIMKKVNQKEREARVMQQG